MGKQGRRAARPVLTEITGNGLLMMDLTCTASLLVVGFVVAVLVALDAIKRFRDFQDEAVEKGYARWVDKGQGKIVFRWGPRWVP